jgi:drug/metabolite transporter (DMT)-like permease
MNSNLTKRESINSQLLLIAPFFLWGTAMVAMKAALPQTTPLFVAGVRLLPAGLLVLAVAAMQGRAQPKSWAGWLWISFFALVDGLMFQGFLAEGLMRTGAGLGSTIIDSQPLAVALLSSWLFAEVIGFWGWLGLIIGILGISLIGLPDSWFSSLSIPQSLSFSVNWLSLLDSGELWMLFASLSMAVGTVTIRFVSRHVDPVVATGWHMVFGGVPLLLASLLWESQPWQNLTLEGWLGLGYATVFGSAIAYGVFFLLASQSNLTSLSSLTFLTPVFALTFSNLFLGEVLTLWQWIGVSLTLVSIYLINQREQLAQQLKLLARFEEN